MVDIICISSAKATRHHGGKLFRRGVEDNVRASGDVYREERRARWLKEAAGTARFTPPVEIRRAAETRGAGNIAGETIDTDRYGEIVCGYLAERPITCRLPRVVFSPLSLSLFLSLYLSPSYHDGSAVRSQPRWRLRVPEFYEARKKGPRFWSQETAFNEVLLEVRALARRWRWPSLPYSVLDVCYDRCDQNVYHQKMSDTFFEGIWQILFDMYLENILTFWCLKKKKKKFMIWILY